MPKQSEFVEYLVESLQGLGRVRARAMFGGFGIYLNDRMFGLVVNDELFLKTDMQIEVYFDELELPYFGYEKQGRRLKMSYRRAPESALDDPDELVEWAARSYQAAQRSRLQPS
ncbi:MAG: TfoX/Sxy family protein [Pseudomonadales bacterium]|nr:TfoX/Sxy family protein [Pseudomonadales bacterium]